MACDGMLGHGLLSRRQVMSVTVSLYVVHLAQRMAAVWIGFQFKHIQAYSVIPAGSTDTVLKQCEHGLPCLDSESIMPESVKLRWAEVNGFEFRHKGIEDSWNNLEQSGTHGWSMLRSLEVFALLSLFCYEFAIQYISRNLPLAFAFLGHHSCQHAFSFVPFIMVRNCKFQAVHFMTHLSKFLVNSGDAVVFLVNSVQIPYGDMLNLSQVKTLCVLSVYRFLAVEIFKII